MREIKFRAWDKVNNRIYTISQLRLPYYNDTLMQYTGLHDKNGKEIYEGDIVKSTWGYGNPPKAVELEDIFYWLGESCVDQEHIEVIGNIYECPGLVPNQ